MQGFKLGNAVYESLIAQVEVSVISVQRHQGLAQQTVQQADAVLSAVRAIGHNSHHGSDYDDQVVEDFGEPLVELLSGVKLVLDIQQTGSENAILAPELIGPEKGKRVVRSDRRRRGDLRILSHSDDGDAVKRPSCAKMSEKEQKCCV